MLTNAVAAAIALKEKIGINVGVINLPWLNEIDAAWLREVVGTASHIFCIDNHYKIGGQGDRIASLIAGDPTLTTTLTSIGISEVPACGTNDEIIKFHRLDQASIATLVKATLGY